MRRPAGHACIEEHPRGSGLYRLRRRIGGRLVTLASGVERGLALDALAEHFPSGRQVYFARAGLLVKIGWSDDVARRLVDLANANGQPLELLATFPGGLRAERMFHAAFREFRHQGEWFHYTGPLVRTVERLRRAA